jgi:hypothetical protein
MDFLDQARVLLRDLIARLQAREPASQTPGSLMRMLVHLVNIQKAVELAPADPSNAVKRLRDFAKTLGRLGPHADEPPQEKEIRTPLIALLVQAADLLGAPDRAGSWETADDSLARVS